MTSDGTPFESKNEGVREHAKIKVNLKAKDANSLAAALKDKGKETMEDIQDIQDDIKETLEEFQEGVMTKLEDMKEDMQILLEWEFSDEDNVLFLGLCKVLRVLSIFNFAMGFFNLISASIVSGFSMQNQRMAWDVKSVLALWSLFSTMLTPITSMYASYLVFSVSQAFSMISKTKGDDIKYLLKGIKKLKKVWNAFPFCEPKLYNNSLTSSCKIRVLDEEYH